MFFQNEIQKALSRRAFLAVAGGLVAVMAARIAAAPPARRIEVTAKRFEFTPSEISVARGTRLTLAVTAIDFVHGFSMPDFEIRKDLTPGKPIEVEKSAMLPAGNWEITAQMPETHYLAGVNSPSK